MRKRVKWRELKYKCAREGMGAHPYSEITICAATGARAGEGWMGYRLVARTFAADVAEDVVQFHVSPH